MQTMLQVHQIWINEMFLNSEEVYRPVHLKVVLRQNLLLPVKTKKKLSTSFLLTDYLSIHILAISRKTKKKNPSIVKLGHFQNLRQNIGDFVENTLNVFLV